MAVYNNKLKTIAGIDEVGRGPIAGPMAIGLAFCIWNNQTKRLLKGIKDSKKLSPKQRKEWLKKIESSGLIKFKVSYIQPGVIDKKGLSWSLKSGIEKVLRGIPVCDIIYLDGGLKASKQYKQETIIKGDEKIPIISAASIFAKVHRDALMEEKARKYSYYSFEKNKGYGTAEHYKAIKKHGLCPIHRKRFLSKLI